MDKDNNNVVGLEGGKVWVRDSDKGGKRRYIYNALNNKDKLKTKMDDFKPHDLHHFHHHPLLHHRCQLQ